MREKASDSKRYAKSSGSLWELECLYDGDRIRTYKKPGKVPYKSEELAVIGCLSNNPNGYKGNEFIDPPSRWMNEVRANIVEILEVDEQRVLVFPSLGTSADKHHGIDFLLLYETEQLKRQVLVSADCSINISKVEAGFAADLLVLPDGAIPNVQVHNDIDFCYLPAIDKDTREGSMKRERETRKGIAAVMADLLLKKERFGDKNHTFVERRQETIKAAVAAALNGHAH